MKCYYLCAVLACSVIQLFSTPWTVARQAPLSLEFFRQEYWSGLPFPSPGIKPPAPTSPAFQVDSLPAEPQGKSLLLPLIFLYSCRSQASERLSDLPNITQLIHERAKQLFPKVHGCNHHEQVDNFSRRW